MGRPPKEIDQTQFEKLCALQCTIDEFCCYFEVDDMTLNAWCKRTYNKSFSEIFRVKKGSGKISLRRKQFEVALAGNPTMLIWLGKNMLGQAEKSEVEVKSEDVTIDFGKIKGDEAE
jgi:hypothetical protein